MIDHRYGSEKKNLNCLYTYFTLVEPKLYRKLEHYSKHNVFEKNNDVLEKYENIKTVVGKDV